MKDLTLTINGKEYKVTIEKFGSEEAVLVVDDQKYTVGLKDLGIEKAPDNAYSGSGDVGQTTTSKKAPKAAAASSSDVSSSVDVGGGVDTGDSIKAPLPGLIMDIKVKVGDTITSGQNVMIMEAMKMENHIPATVGGVIKSLEVKVGDSVAEGQVLLVLE